MSAFPHNSVSQDTSADNFVLLSRNDVNLAAPLDLRLALVQVLNDLLDPGRANLRMREDPHKGFFAENIKEETLVSVEHALSVIAAGDAHRKVQNFLYHSNAGLQCRPKGCAMGALLVANIIYPMP